MLLMNRSPFARMHHDMNALFNSVFSEHPGLTGPARSFAPPMNVWEDGSSYFIEAELPGFTLNDVEVTVADEQVTISGKRNPAETQGATYLRRERFAGEFTRSWTLPGPIEADRVEASLNNGVLLVKLPKSEKALPRKIEVRASAK